MHWRAGQRLTRSWIELDLVTSSGLKSAVGEIEEQKDQHLYHSKGFCRELWIKYLGMNAVLPPPEEKRKVKSAVGAARAEKAADRQRRR
jgi:hypothetical protein